jgi:hypothetical protein
MEILEREVEYTIEVCRADLIAAAAVETQEYHFLSHEERKEHLKEIGLV